jgi:hypothetical protein
MTHDEGQLRDTLRQHIKDCEDKAAAALDANSPVGARDWYDAIFSAQRAIRELESRPREPRP